VGPFVGTPWATIAMLSLPLARRTSTVPAAFLLAGEARSNWAIT
jgi:hypothetical protein